MMSSSQAHISDERLEQYLLGRLPETEVNEVEDHLLVCPSCQDLLEETQEYMTTMKVATAKALSNPQQAPREPVRSNWLRSVFATPKPVLAAAACVLFAFVLFVPRNSQTATIELESLRGPEAAAQAPANTKLTLRLSLAGLETATGPFEVQVADAGGLIVARSSAEADGSRAVARVEPLGLGVYWVRLHQKGELVREFGLGVR
jgi:anti-sigma factor RsiW